jgi:hypothetical protein
MMVMVLVTSMAVVMLVALTMPVYRRLICAAFGIEWRLDFDDARAELRCHFCDHMVPPNAQIFREKLRRHMAIAEMPGEPRTMQGVDTADFQQRLGRCQYFNQTIVLQYKCVAMAQEGGFRKVEQKCQPMRTPHIHTATMAVVEGEHDAVGRFTRP